MGGSAMMGQASELGYTRAPAGQSSPIGVAVSPSPDVRRDGARALRPDPHATAQR
jgi:hypothetical protein